MIGEMLKQFRKSKKITQEELAEKMNVSSETISRWERGTRQPRFDELQSYAAYIGVDVQTLMGLEKSASEEDERSSERYEKPIYDFKITPYIACEEQAAANALKMTSYQRMQAIELVKHGAEILLRSQYDASFTEDDVQDRIRYGVGKGDRKQPPERMAEDESFVFSRITYAEILDQARQDSKRAETREMKEAVDVLYKIMKILWLKGEDEQPRRLKAAETPNS